MVKAFNIAVRDRIRVNDDDVAIFGNRVDYMFTDPVMFDPWTVVDGGALQWVHDRGYLGPSPKAMQFINTASELDIPLVISEWHLGAQDSGSSLTDVESFSTILHDFLDTQEERGICYREIMYRLVSQGSVVGSNWFYWYDPYRTDVSGVVGNYGLVHSQGSSIDELWQPFGDMMIETNHRVLSVDPASRTWNGTYIPGSDGVVGGPEVGQRVACLCEQPPAGVLLFAGICGAVLFLRKRYGG